MKWNVIVLLISTLKVVLFSRSFLISIDSSLSPSPTSCTGTSIRLSPSSSSLFWSLYHSNIFINMTVIIPTMTKRPTLCQNCLPKNIFFIVSRDDAQDFRPEKKTKTTTTRCRCLQSLYMPTSLPSWVHASYSPSCQSYHCLTCTYVGAERCPDDYNRVKQKPAGGWVGWGFIGLIFAGYVPLVSQSPHPIIVYSVANYRPHLSYFWANM